MKKILLISCYSLCILSVAISQVQIGINTSDPKGLLHIGNTANNDVIIGNPDSNGIMGIGTTDPQEKLHIKNGDMKIKGKLTIKDGSEAAGRILHTSPTNQSQWKVLSKNIGELQTGSIQYISLNSTNPDVWFDVTNQPLILDEGTWLVFTKVQTLSTCYQHSVWLQLRGNNIGTLSSIAASAEVGGGRYSEPLLIHQVTLSQPEEIRVFMQDLSGCAKVSNFPSLGKCTLYAIRMATN